MEVVNYILGGYFGGQEEGREGEEKEEMEKREGDEKE